MKRITDMTCDHCLKTVTALTLDSILNLWLCNKCLGKIGKERWKEIADEQLQ